jgi:hypothetical protein
MKTTAALTFVLAGLASLTSAANSHKDIKRESHNELAERGTAWNTPVCRATAFETWELRRVWSKDHPDWEYINVSRINPT